MFNLSKKVEYGLELLTYLAENQDAGPIALKDVAEKRDLPYKYMEHIAADLRDAGFITSKEGKGGGYMLRKSPPDVAIADVVTILAGPVALGACASCPRARGCSQQSVWSSVGDSVREALKEKTLEDLVAD
jgi:Rrf2 family protein